MKDMIYFGAFHEGSSDTATRNPQKLIYRGVRHDGMARAPKLRAAGIRLCWFGVTYSVPAATADALPGA